MIYFVTTAIAFHFCSEFALDKINKALTKKPIFKFFFLILRMNSVLSREDVAYWC